MAKLSAKEKAEKKAKMDLAARQLLGTEKIAKIAERVPYIGRVVKLGKLIKAANKLKKNKIFQKPKATIVKQYDPAFPTEDFNKVAGISKDVAQDIKRASKNPAVSDAQAKMINKVLEKLEPARTVKKITGQGVQSATRELKGKGLPKEEVKMQIAKRTKEGEFDYNVSARSLTGIEKQLGLTSKTKDLLAKSISRETKEKLSQADIKALAKAREKFKIRSAAVRKKYSGKNAEKFNRLNEKINRDFIRAKNKAETKFEAKGKDKNIDARERSKPDTEEDVENPKLNIMEGTLKFPEAPAKSGTPEYIYKTVTGLNKGGLVDAGHYFRKVKKK